MPWFVSINFEDGEIESSLRCVIKIYQKHPELSCTQVSRESSGKSPFLSVSRVWKTCRHLQSFSRNAYGEGFSFHFLGSRGGDVFAQRCFAVRNCPQPSATVRNHSQSSATVGDEGAMAVPTASAAKVDRSGHLCNFQTRCNVVS